MFVDFEILILYIVLNLKWYNKSLTLKALILDVHVSAESCVPWLTSIVATVVTMSVDCFLIVVKIPSLIF